MADDLAECVCNSVSRFMGDGPGTTNPGASAGFELTDKPRPKDFLEEVFTMNVLTRLLYNEYGRGFGPGWDKRQLMRIMNNPGDCGNAVNWDEQSHVEFREQVVNFCLGELLGQGYLRWEEKGRSREDPLNLN